MNEKQKQIYRYLRDKAGSGKKFFKSKYMKEELDMSSKEIGLNILELQSKVKDLEIEKWSYTKGTTWKVEPKNSDGKQKVTA